MRKICFILALCAGMFLMGGCAKSSYQDYDYSTLAGREIFGTLSAEESKGDAAFALICDIAAPYLLTQPHHYDYPATDKNAMFARVALVHYRILYGMEGIDAEKYYREDLEKYVYPADLFEEHLNALFYNLQIDYPLLTEIEVYDPQEKAYRFYYGGYGSVSKWEIASAKIDEEQRLAFTINVYPNFEEPTFYPVHFLIRLDGTHFQYESVQVEG